jgi:hypothetical protein
MVRGAAAAVSTGLAFGDPSLGASLFNYPSSACVAASARPSSGGHDPGGGFSLFTTHGQFVCQAVVFVASALLCCVIAGEEGL